MKIFLLFYFFINSINPSFAISESKISPLSSSIWRETLKIQANLGETGDTLIEKGESNPLFFGRIIGGILREGFMQYPNNFFNENKMLLLFVIQQFRSLRETSFRENILSLTPFFPLEIQKEISKIELNFLLEVSPKESVKRAREIHTWTKVIKNLPFAKESYLILLEKTNNSAIRNLLIQSAKEVY